ncbi:MAG: hypothetical protein U0V56_11180 [Actinomycetota bacterium]
MPLRDLARVGAAPGPERLPAYASIPTLSEPAAYADEMARRLEEGYTAAKVHAWGEPRRDLDDARRA